MFSCLVSRFALQPPWPKLSPFAAPLFLCEDVLRECLSLDMRSSLRVIDCTGPIVLQHESLGSTTSASLTTVQIPMYLYHSTVIHPYGCSLDLQMRHSSPSGSGNLDLQSVKQLATEWRFCRQAFVRNIQKSIQEGVRTERVPVLADGADLLAVLGPGGDMLDRGYLCLWIWSCTIAWGWARHVFIAVTRAQNLDVPTQPE